MAASDTASIAGRAQWWNERGGEGWPAPRQKVEALQCGLLRDIFGTLPFRPLRPIDPAWMRWNGGTIIGLAWAAFQERHLPSGLLDNARLAVLADALEEAGGTEGDILGHLRGPGPHVRGCWLVDLFLGKS